MCAGLFSTLHPTGAIADIAWCLLKEIHSNEVSALVRT